MISANPSPPKPDAYICQGDTKHLRNSNLMQPSEQGRDKGHHTKMPHDHIGTQAGGALSPLCLDAQFYASNMYLTGRIKIAGTSTKYTWPIRYRSNLSNLGNFSNQQSNESLWMHHDAADASKFQALCLRSWHLPASPQKSPQPICVHLHLRSENDKAK